MYNNDPNHKWRNNVTGKRQTTEFNLRHKNTRHAIRDFYVFVLIVLILFWLSGIIFK